ncbi:hypothetical protein FO519_008594 [Halicephalobus sp. NKZ332]|nr:hypothetical protein FO519_008594 [Halicephalobus sp. NKZ332]
MIQKSLSCLAGRLRTSIRGDFIKEWGNLEFNVNDCARPVAESLPVRKLRTLNGFQYFVHPVYPNEDCSVITLGIGEDVNAEEAMMKKYPIKSPPGVSFALWDIGASCNFLTMSAISVEFVYRYLLLCKNKTISLKLYLLMFGGALIGAVLFGLNGWIGYFAAGKNDTIKAESSLGWILKDDDGKVGAVGAIAHGTSQCYFAMFIAILLSFGSYSIIAYCTWEIFTFMKENEQVFSKSVRKVNRDLNKMLIVQAACPIFSYVMPIGILAIGLLFPTIPVAIPGFVVSLAFPWGPTENAASVLWLVTAYRRKLISIITCNPSVYNNRLHNTRNINQYSTTQNSQNRNKF